MSWYRIYVDKKINAKGEGGEHSRVFDTEADDPATALSALKLKADEEVNQIVELSGDPT